MSIVKKLLKQMKKHAKKYFIPHEGNDYKPHFLQEASVAVVTLIIIASFFASFIHTATLISKTDFLAAVLPGVLVDLTNEERAGNNLGTLRINPTLEAAAQLKAIDMASKGYFAHESPEGLSPWYWFSLSGYQFTHAGENLAVNFSDSDDVVNAWMNSPGHRANILNSGFTEIGIATARGTYKGRNTIFVVQMFGKPTASVQGASTEAPSDPEPTIELTTEGPIASEAETSEDSGDEEDVAPTTFETLEVTDESQSENEMFIAVVDTETIENDEELSTTTMDEEEVATSTAVGSASNRTPTYSNFFERMWTQPQTVLRTLYLSIAFLILLALILSIAIEAKKQHIMGVVYGCLMLLLISGLTVLNKTILFSDLIIAGWSL